MSEHAERVFPQPLGIMRSVENDGQNSSPSLGRDEARVLVTALGPGDEEAVVGSPDDTRDVDRDLNLSDLAERISRAGIVVESSDCGKTTATLAAEPTAGGNRGRLRRALSRYP
jgi:hypothetical protein